MRFAASLVLSLAALSPALSPAAFAADYSAPPLPEPTYAPSKDDFNWGGLYGGIHVNVTSADFKNANTIKSLAADAYYVHIAQDLATSFARLRTGGSDQQNGIGGFVGYNWLWEDAVLGLELDYTHLQDPLRASGVSDPWPDGRRKDRSPFSDNVSYTATARSQMGDYLIAKARGGYAFGRFLPYATLGVVVAKQRNQATYNSTYIEYTIDPTTNAITGINSTSARNASFAKFGYNVGGAIGVGLEYAVLDNVIVRAEYQHIGMADYKSMRTTLNTARAGVAVKY